MAEATKVPCSPKYIFDNAAEQAGARFKALSTIYDPDTIRHLIERGVDRGWHCLEVGGGNGSIAAWLGVRVGPEGRVLVTDIDTRYLEGLEQPNIEVKSHNIVEDELPEGAFDLVHSRLVLLHLPKRDQALGRMIAALKPGGWLVDEEFDSTSVLADTGINSSEILPKTHFAMWHLMEDRGVERRFGRLLPGRMRAHGLTAVGAEGRLFMWEGGSPGASLTRANYEQIRADLIGAGYLTEEEFEMDIAGLEAPEFLMASPIMWTAWGQRPQAQQAFA
jgi:ubiquinone/menaquinone biosynthesis C-methylase UbiE